MTILINETDLWDMWDDHDLRIATLAVIQEVKYQLTINNDDVDWDDERTAQEVAIQSGQFTSESLANVAATLFAVHTHDYRTRDAVMPLSMIKVLEDMVDTWFDDDDRNACNLLMRDAFLRDW